MLVDFMQCGMLIDYVVCDMLVVFLILAWKTSGGFGARRSKTLEGFHEILPKDLGGFPRQLGVTR